MPYMLPFRPREPPEPGVYGVHRKSIGIGWFRSLLLSDVDNSEKSVRRTRFFIDVQHVQESLSAFHVRIQER